MSRKRFSVEQIINHLREAEVLPAQGKPGTPAARLSRRHGASRPGGREYLPRPQACLASGPGGSREPRPVPPRNSIWALITRIESARPEYPVGSVAQFVTAAYKTKTYPIFKRIWIGIPSRR